MARLRKTDVEQLTGTFDRDPVGALTVALRRTTGRPTAEWVDLVASLPIDEPRTRRLLERDLPALEQLLRDLIEMREIPVPDAGGSQT